MSDAGTFRVVILWEHEIRAAAKALQDVSSAIGKLRDDEPLPPELTSLVWQAFETSFAALHGATDTDSCLVLSSAPDVVKKIKESKRRANP